MLAVGLMTQNQIGTVATRVLSEFDGHPCLLDNLSSMLLTLACSLAGERHETLLRVADRAQLDREGDGQSVSREGASTLGRQAHQVAQVLLTTELKDVDRAIEELKHKKVDLETRLLKTTQAEKDLRTKSMHI